MLKRIIMFMVGCFAFLRRGHLQGKTNTLSKGKQTALFLLTLIMFLFLQVQPSWSATTLYAGFAGAGIWQYDGTTWTQATPNIPQLMAVSGNTLYGAFTGQGIWQYNGITWTQVTPNTPQLMAVSGNTLYGAFTGQGIWQYNGTTWTQATPNTPQLMAVSGNTLYGAFTGQGIWQYNGTTWTQVSPNTPQLMAVSGSTLYCAFTGAGIWKYNGATWSQVTPITPTIMTTTDSTLYGTFAGAGIWQWNGTIWTQASPNTPTIMTATDSTLYGTFAGAGIWQWNGTIWTQASPASPAIMAATGLNQYGDWTWMSGSITDRQPGIYGTKGVAAAGNVPGGRYSSVFWQDNSGNFWLFGGLGYDSTSNESWLNDLWKYDGTNWTWVSGSNIRSQAGSYGTKGVAAAGNVPGARGFSVSWQDNSGNLWLFGGEGSGGERLNDLWKYDGANWTWVSGSNTGNHIGIYGTKGVAAAGNVPGARDDLVSWIDSSGNFWLFGGQGYDSVGNFGYLNDLWKYDGANWSWVSGSTTNGQVASYGTKGVAAAGNVPGARAGSVSWIDSSGNFWLFGGGGYDSEANLYYLNDLWKYDGANWTWISGSNTVNQTGSYGTKGVAAAGNVPGARVGSAIWKDSNGNVWLLGGYYSVSADNGNYLNDLWKYDGANWTWMNGSNTINQAGSYGTEGVAAAGNVPGARSNSVFWKDSSGNFRLFGGAGYDSADNIGELNDLWRYLP